MAIPWFLRPSEIGTISPDDITNSDSLYTFKKKLTKTKKCPQWYYTQHREAQKIHAQLRMEVSSLNYHMTLRHLSDNPSCRCGATKRVKWTLSSKLPSLSWWQDQLLLIYCLITVKTQTHYSMAIPTTYYYHPINISLIASKNSL